MRPRVHGKCTGEGWRVNEKHACYAMLKSWNIFKRAVGIKDFWKSGHYKRRLWEDGGTRDWTVGKFSTTSLSNREIARAWMKVTAVRLERVWQNGEAFSGANWGTVVLLGYGKEQWEEKKKWVLFLGSCSRDRVDTIKKSTRGLKQESSLVI